MKKQPSVKERALKGEWFKIGGDVEDTREYMITDIPDGTLRIYVDRSRFYGLVRHVTTKGLSYHTVCTGRLVLVSFLFKNVRFA